MVVAAWLALAGSLPGDARLLRAVSAALGTRLDHPMRVAAFLGSAWVLAPAAAIAFAALLAGRHLRHAVLVLAGAAVVWAVNPALKRVFARSRPTERPILEPVSAFSFPSGHAVASMTAAALLVVLLWPTRWRRPAAVVGAVAVGVVGASQIVLGVHHPSDLLAGWALGMAAVCGIAAWVLVPPGGSGSD